MFQYTPFARRSMMINFAKPLDVRFRPTYQSQSDYLIVANFCFEKPKNSFTFAT
jgi:hypothetical protein